MKKFGYVISVLFLMCLALLCLTACDNPSYLLHSYSQWETVKEATCLEEGQQQRTCVLCGAVETRVIEKSNSHVDGTWEVVESYCDENGKQNLMCARCGKVIRTEEIGPLGHTFGDWTDVANEGEIASCTEAGKETRQCTRCGHSETRIKDKLGHSYSEWIVLEEATCIKAGTQVRYCRRCGNKDGYEGNINALGHSYGEWNTTQEPTCLAAGEKERICTRCDHVDTGVVPALGPGAHTYSEWTIIKEDTCTVDGLKEKTCSCCGNVVQEVIKHGHAYSEWVVTKLPTCTEQGKQNHYCTRCDNYEEQVIEALGHTYGTEWTIVEPTCTVNGAKFHKCVRCDTRKNETEIPAEHLFIEWVVTTPASCTEDGEKTSTCSKCGAKTATRPISALGHNYGDWEVTEAATCTHAGSKHRLCTRAGCTNPEDVASISSLGHNYGEWTVDVEPTCTENGSESRICSRCDVISSRAIIALGHDPDTTSWVIDLQPTCTEPGSKSHHCRRAGCDNKDDVTPIAALGHIDEDRDGMCDHLCGTNLVEEKTEVVITIDDKFIIYGEDNLPLTYSMVPASIDEDLQLVISRDEGNDIGEYRIKIEWKNNNNAYVDITFNEGTYYIADPGLRYRYDAEKGGYFVTGYEGEETKVTIENKYNDGENGLKAVIGIDKAAFRDNRTITEVSIAESVEYIGNVAFSGCTAITKIDFKDVNGWYCLKASDAGAQENWMEKEAGTIFALGEANANANTLVNSEEKVDYYWYKGITLAP